MSPGEIEVMETFAFVASKCFWRWRRITDVMKIARTRGLSAAQIGKVLSKLAKHDDRIECKNVHNAKLYLLPPEDVHHYQFSDDVADFNPDDV